MGCDGQQLRVPLPAVWRPLGSRPGAQSAKVTSLQLRGRGREGEGEGRREVEGGRKEEKKRTHTHAQGSSALHFPKPDDKQTNEATQVADDHGSAVSR